MFHENLLWLNEGYVSTQQKLVVFYCQNEAFLTMNMFSFCRLRPSTLISCAGGGMGYECLANDEIIFTRRSDQQLLMGEQSDEEIFLLA